MRPRPHACPAALAFLSAGQHDVRPHLVALYYADHQPALRPVLTYGEAYMRAWCERNAIAFPDHAILAAVSHGLLRLWRPNDAGHTDRRACEVGMRAGVFRLLTNKALQVYRSRLTEGAALFVQVAAGSEEPLPAGTLLSPWPESSWWNPREAGRPARPNLLGLKVGNRERPPASDPRALPRDNGQQLSLWAA